MLTDAEKIQFEKIKLKIVGEMGMANEWGGADRLRYVSQLSFQVMFVNYETYRKRQP